MSGGTSAAHAAYQKRKEQKEEEEMTRYRRDELDNEWEFKIVRSVTGEFRRRETIEKLKAEEAAAGWVMVEKFDNSRIRLKRLLRAQRNDELLPYHIDPYRTTYGLSESGLALIIIGSALVVTLLILILSGAFG